MTNYEYLMQNMTLEEFARDRTTCDECPQGGRDKCDKKCMEHMLAWLKAEHRENEMDDLISRQAAIDAAKHAWAKGLEPSQYIEIIPPAQPEQRWIPVTERLPEVPGMYMVTEVLIDGSRCISFADFGMVHTSSLFSFRKSRFEVAFGTDYFYDGERHDDEFYRQFSHTDIYDTKEVTAWKYIPKPYGGET